VPDGTSDTNTAPYCSTCEVWNNKKEETNVVVQCVEDDPSERLGLALSLYMLSNVGQNHT